MKWKILSLLTATALVLSLLAGVAPRAAAETPQAAEPAVTLGLSRDGSSTVLSAAYTGTADAPTALLIAAGYDGTGRMRTADTEVCDSGCAVTFPYDNQYSYRVFAVQPDAFRPLCEASSEIGVFSGRAEIPYVDGPTAQAVSVAARQCLDARIALEKVLELDPTQAEGDREVFEAQMEVLQDAMKAYDDLMATGAVLYCVANAQADAMEEDAASALALQGRAALQSSQDEALLQWAQELTRQYDAINGPKKLAALGEMMGCDARTAYQQFTIAQEVLREHYEGKAETASKWITGLTVVKTGAKVSLFVGSCIATGGAAGMVTAGEATGLLIGSADVSIELLKTGATLVYGDEGKQTKLVEDLYKPVQDVIAIYSLLTFDITKANDAEILAFFGDMKQSIEENYGALWNEMKDFNLTDAENILSLTVDVNSTVTTPEKVQEVIGETGGETPDAPETPAREELEQTRDSLDGTEEGERPPLTDENLDETLTAILEDAQVLEEGQTLEDLNTREFEQKVIEDMQDNNFDDDDGSDPPPPTYPRFHDDGPGNTHRYVYWENKQGNKVGLCEHYYRDVLESQKFYDDGKILWEAYYHTDSGTPTETGQITQRNTYSDGYEIGSVRSETHYFYTDPINYLNPPEYAIGQVRYTEQWIYQLAHDDETDEDYKTDYRYYGAPHCDYDYADGSIFLAERNSGSGIYWQKREVFDHNDKLSFDVVDNGDGTVTLTDYYTQKNPGGYWRFDPTDHAKNRYIYTYNTGYYDFLNDWPGYEEKTKEETWEYGVRETDHVYETDEDGNEHLVRYTMRYGYDHRLLYPTKELIGFEEVFSETIDVS